MDKNSEYVFKAYIVNANEYDNGNKETSGEWLYFPTTKDEVSALFEKIGLPDNAEDKTYFIDSYVSDDSTLAKCLPMYADIDELNYLAARITELDETEKAVFDMALHVEEIKDVSDLINLTYNTEYYELVPDIYNSVDLAKHFLKEKNIVLGDAYDYFDFEKYGIDMERINGGSLRDGIYLQPGCAEWSKVYDSDLGNIPPEYIVTGHGREIYFDTRLQASMELALEIDGYLREHSTEYVSKYTIPDEPPVYISDCLMNCDTLALKDMLTATSTLEGDALVDKIYEFDDKYPYDEKERGKMTVLVVEPMREPYTKEIDSGLGSLQKEVDGRIQAIYPFEEKAAIICNDEGKISGLTLNRALYDEDGEIYDVVAGTFLICGLTEDSFGSLPGELIKKFSEQFKQPEMFFMHDGKLRIIPVETLPVAKPSIKEQLRETKQDKQQPKLPKKSEPEL